MLSFKKKMPTNLLGVGIIIVFLLILFFMCRAQPPKEKLRWPTLLKKEIEDGTPPQFPNKLKFFYV